ncbi:Calpain-C, partial [Gryllus bimaculatus]
DPKWTEVDADTRKKLEYANDEDGQFFMKAAHFKKSFSEFTMASPCPNFGDFYGTPTQQIYIIKNVWEEGISLEGDGIEYAENFLRNPQYLLTVEELDKENDNTSEEEDQIYPIYDIIIQVVQDQNRSKYESEQSGIGVTVFQTGGRFPEELNAENFEEFEPLKGSKDTINRCSVIAKLKLKSGKYIVVPFIFDSGIGRPFLMRVYSSRPIIIEPIEHE